MPPHIFYAVRRPFRDIAGFQLSSPVANSATHGQLAASARVYGERGSLDVRIIQNIKVKDFLATVGLKLLQITASWESPNHRVVICPRSPSSAPLSLPRACRERAATRVHVA